ncbi:MAG: YqaE/Pmp3 family membrane protein [Oscillatoriophycideae cyanobacterium NC_groundwater_1537_Pr4_S-0.65um_50_18]|nr:YqaE/Pmp3 family membrane protein [Oscillatoriophycideae cyanobacterium NC_groundwater_1537_Pr4_S-0.65um_50_18]
MKLVRFALGILLPPVGVFMAYGVSTTLLINILLTLLGWLPGVIHAVWALAKHEEKINQQINQQEGSI